MFHDANTIINYKIDINNDEIIYTTGSGMKICFNTLDFVSTDAILIRMGYIFNIRSDSSNIDSFHKIDIKIENNQFKSIEPRYRSLLHGTVIYYDMFNFKTIQYVMGVKEGISIKFDIAGAPTIIENYHNDKLHGERIHYSNGQIIFKEHYLNGLRNGMNEIYRLDGSLELQAEFVDGYKHGKHIRYSSKGEVIISVCYVFDRPHGLAYRKHLDDTVDVAIYNFGKIHERKNNYDMNDVISSLQWHDWI